MLSFFKTEGPTWGPYYDVWHEEDDEHVGQLGYEFDKNGFVFYPDERRFLLTATELRQIADKLHELNQNMGASEWHKHKREHIHETESKTYDMT